ncbi:MAG: hypothetical protein JNK58_06955 [Phycisphaerae bacterium]|nr:hypothetical protein [Phycisphaerae bacterium]
MQIWKAIGLLAAACVSIEAAAQCEPMEVQRVQPADASFFSLFGAAVAMSGDPADRAIIGAFLQDGVGAAYVYRRVGSTWVPDGKLTASDGAEGSYFGTSVGVFGDYAIVGAPGTDDGEGNDLPGAAYIYQRVNGTWVQKQKLTVFPGTEFGSSVSISQGRAMIGDPADFEAGPDAGAVYVFRLAGDTWTLEEKIIATDATEADYFGSAVYLDGQRAIIGSLFNDQSQIESGAAYIYIWNGSFWFKQAKIAPSDPEQEKWFGFAVHIVGDIAVVGAPRDDSAGIDAGAAYFFEWNGVDWSESFKTVGSNTGTGDYFGNAVGTDGRKVFVGGYSNDGLAGPDSGAAYTFIKPAGEWQQTNSVVSAGNAAAFDSYAISLVVRGEWALVGSLSGGSAGLFAGSAYFYNFHAPATGDATNDNSVTFADITAVLTHWGATYPGPAGTTGPGDANHNGVVNFSDITAVLTNFGAQCP